MGLRRKTLVQQAKGYIDTGVDFAQHTALPALSDAKDKALPVLADAKDKALPVLADAKDKALPVLADVRDSARDKAAPYLSQGADFAADRASTARDAARSAAESKVAQLKGEKPKKSKLKRVVLIAGLSAAVAVLAKKLQGGKATDNWQSSYTPAPAPTPKPAPTTTSAPVTGSAPQAGLDDAAGATPDEAIADATEAPTKISTPDEPADVIDIETKDKLTD